MLNTYGSSNTNNYLGCINDYTGSVMAIASKTTLVDLRCVRVGAPFVNVCTRADIDTSGISDYIYQGNTFFGVADQTTNIYPSSTYPIRLGAPFKEIAARATWDGSFGQGRTRLGAPFHAPFDGTSTYPEMEAFPTRLGAPFQEQTTKSSINASEFDVYRMGAPFWVAFIGGPPPVVYNAAQMFMVF